MSDSLANDFIKLVTTTYKNFSCSHAPAIVFMLTFSTRAPNHRTMTLSNAARPASDPSELSADLTEIEGELSA
jgi:hypothetical protein